ncbi:hypothetical protein ANN_22818 [Periplaneta americana]|uniref:SGNH hydrolase-type esterase domain-containing protein n=1 Tax=Periplaneta americana TaxID=6978 RepID=A0ABQ8SKD7_PERAM|nr:hypothetical protein ANN_22818 [Periplaneta americana]
MAASQIACTCAYRNNRNIEGNQDHQCTSCAFLQLELCKVSTELKTAWEIIRILQENANQIATNQAHTMAPRHNVSTVETWSQPDRKRGRNIRTSLVENIPTSNRFTPLQYEERHQMSEEGEKVDGEGSRPIAAKAVKQTSSSRPNFSTRKKHKILVIGDSHARGCASELRRDEENDQKDTVVIWGGSNDIARNNTDNGLRHLQQFVERNDQTNIIVMNALHRHDLPTTSCVNSEVVNFNRKLKKRLKVYNHVKVNEIDLNRDNFTRHGLHLNGKGKEAAVRKIAAILHSKLILPSTPIALQWNDDQSQGLDQPNDETCTRASSRSSKAPARLQDSLCPSLSRKKRQRSLSEEKLSSPGLDLNLGDWNYLFNGSPTRW